MKSAMQELIEILESVGWKLQEEIKSELLEKEKQQIIEAYHDGGEKGFNKFGEDAEQYYNETFNNGN